MNYQQTRASRPPPVFELRIKTAINHLKTNTHIAHHPSQLKSRLHDLIETTLLAENMPPTPHSITKLFDGFSKLFEVTQSGQPLLYKKRDTLSLIFNIYAVQSEMYLHCPDDLVLGYTQSMMGFLLLTGDIEQIGMVGLGGGSLTKFCYRHLPKARIEVAEIDEQVIGLRNHFCIPDDDARLGIYCMDGSDFVRQSENRFDVLLIDGYDSNGQPPQLCSQDFYDDCYRALRPGGVLVVNLISGSSELESYSKRIQQSFQDSAIVINAIDSLNMIAFACKGSMLNLDDETVAQRINQLDFLHPMLLRITAQNIQSRMRRWESPSLHSSPSESV
jgi:spermidine synthase